MTDICRLALAYIGAHPTPDMTMRQLAFLGLVCDQPGQSVKALSIDLGVSEAAITHMHHRITKHGLVTITKNPRDRRLVQIWPTDAGRTFRQGLHAL